MQAHLAAWCLQTWTLWISPLAAPQRGWSAPGPSCAGWWLASTSALPQWLLLPSGICLTMCWVLICPRMGTALSHGTNSHTTPSAANGRASRSVSVQCIILIVRFPSTVRITLCSVLHIPCGYMSLLFLYQQCMCDVLNSQCPGSRALQFWDEDCTTAVDVTANLMILASHAGSLFACCGNQSYWFCSYCTSP